MDIFIAFFLCNVESKVKKPWSKGDLVRSAVLAECCWAVKASFIIYCVLEKNTGIMPRYTIAGVMPSRAQGLLPHQNAAVYLSVVSKDKEVQLNRFLFMINLSASDTTQ